ncbi:hypothetical protein [Brevibacillus sp. DP1.3A]|uniref:hypothetical protein n=1 Tax=Brevibacillus sp. DP1.3A TaxID=2738867 RepID=UPI00156B6F76|nr:hypothetical protein [Brevibacillus sp. DP1.3A]UED78088.1 hypothetical protein HP399_030655 [Brevibacillus sp. DP1.3A]
MSEGVAGWIKKQYMSRERLNTYIACEDYDFTWDLSEVQRFRDLWREGHSIIEIAKELGRLQIEVAILALDQGEQTRIHPRFGGVFGNSIERADESHSGRDENQIIT